MSDVENRKLDEIFTVLNTFTTQQELHNANVSKEIESIKRGIYGDEQNQVLGLLKRQSNDEILIAEIKKDVGSLKGFKKRVVVAGGILIGLLEGVWHFIKDLWS